MKIIVRVISVLGSVAWIAWLVILTQFLSKLGDGSANHAHSNSDIILGACPFIYFATAFCTTFANRRGFELLVAGIISHSVLAGFYFSIYQAGFKGGIVLVPMIFCGIIWTLFYISLSDEKAG